MSAIYPHQAKIRRMVLVDDDGVSEYSWSTKFTGLPCRLDTVVTSIIKDVTWRQEAGRAPDRLGILFFQGDPDIHAGDRAEISDGHGTFEIIANPDRPASASGKVDHLECQAREISSALAPGDPT